MKGQLRIGKMFAFIVLDDDGTEGVAAFQRGGVWLPMVGADLSRVDSLRPVAQQIADATGKKITLCVFEGRTEVETIEPMERPS